MDVIAEAEQDRRELVELLEQLAPQEWDQPSLCAGWRVRDVVAHVYSFEDLGKADLARLLVAGRLSFDRMGELALSRHHDLAPADLVERARRFPRPTGVTAARGGAVGLVDGLIHQQDIRRPLGRPREIPAERLRYALGFALTAPPLRGLWKLRGVRVVAEDAEWAHGRGPQARGPGEAVLMVAAGRRGAAADLTGPGADVLRQRFG